MDMVQRLVKKAPMARVLAEKIEETTNDAITYVRRHNLRRIGRDLAKRVSRNPTQSMIAMTAIGFLAGILVRRR